MTSIRDKIVALVQAADVRISEHGYEELAIDGLSARELVQGIDEGILVEAYPDYPKGPCILLLQKDGAGRPVHVVWGIPKGHENPAVLVTAYRPDPARWNRNFTERK